MYRLKEIQDALLHLVGWEQSYNPATAIEQAMTDTQSGLYFQGAHPLVTLDNVRAIMPEQFIFQYPDWNATVNYSEGNKVKLNDVVYIALLANINVEPNATAPEWKVYSFLTDYLESETRKGIAKAIQEFTTIKQLDKETRSLLERRAFFDGAGRLAATIDNRDRLVGYEITPVRSMGVTTKVERIGLQFTGGTGIIKLYVFHSNSVEPYKEIEVDYTLTNGGFQWFPMDNLYLPYISSDTNAGGSWFICYDQRELPIGMEAITVSKDWSREPCMGCNVGDIQVWREMTKYISISPFTYKAPEDFNEFPEMWDISKNIYTNTVNYGINCEVSIGCDLTDFIIAQKGMFANVVQKQVAASLLRTMAMNPDVRVNRNQSNVSRMDILYELDGNTAGVRPSGLGNDLYRSYKALKIDTQGIDRICLSCNNHGVRYRTV